MSDQNRGAYTPQSEAPLAFDARQSSGPGERPTPFALLASAAVLIILVIALAIFFFKGSKEPEAAAPPAIDAMKSAPPVAEAQPAERTGLQVYADGEPIAEAPAFTPAPEAPAARPTTPAPAVAPVAQPAPAQPRVAATPPAPRVVPNPPVTAPAPVAQPTPRPAPVAAAPATPPARPIDAAPTRRVTDTPPPPTSTAQVQIGAFSSAALADGGWNEVARLLPGQMAGKTKRVEPVARDGSTLYRASVGGFASRQEAAAFCEALKSRSRACLVRN